MANVIRLKRNESTRQLKSKLPAAQKNSNGISAKKYSGEITLTKDPAEFQRRMRNEWN
jgi:hypothetical protein